MIKISFFLETTVESRTPELGTVIRFFILLPQKQLVENYERYSFLEFALIWEVGKL
jgi:hypothetical protein